MSINFAEGNIIDVKNRRIFPGEIHIKDSKITKIVENKKKYDSYLAPGFIDAHVHIESSMLTPVNFAELIIQKGTIAIVNDPHEIANVLGVDGINFMIENSRKAPVKCFFGIPSCVPASPFDVSGAIIDAKTVEELAKTGNFTLLSEMMNFPGVIGGDTEVLKKLEVARRYRLPVDGHAPSVNKNDLAKYIAEGIKTDHETSTLQEAVEKIDLGMKIMIREGSAAKNYDALKSLIKIHTDCVMFCTDDAHPDDIIASGHINKIVRMALADGFDLFDVWRIASINPVDYYHLPVGCLQEGDFADFIRIENLDSLEIREVYIDGIKKYDFEDNQRINSDYRKKTTIYPNKFRKNKITSLDIEQEVNGELLTIGVIENQILTKKRYFSVSSLKNLEADIERDILKIVYLNRYSEKPPQIAFIHGIGLERGAFASSIAHDSHHILAIGCCDADIVEVINKVIEYRGALVACSDGKIACLPLPVAGIMSDKNAVNVAEQYQKVNQLLKTNGCKLTSPFMTLAFMSLLVLPEIKIGEKGLFDYASFSFLDHNK